MQRALGVFSDFYPRSPCGERRPMMPTTPPAKRFLSTLSLRRATWQTAKALNGLCNFYPRSPCGERPGVQDHGGSLMIISIHALLAESDKRLKIAQWAAGKFLSTLSLRRATGRVWVYLAGVFAFLSTLSLRRATTCKHIMHPLRCQFLSTLSLRRATPVSLTPHMDRRYFYPRSPCGERLPTGGQTFEINLISIHALLAESDLSHFSTLRGLLAFLSTLSLRRATYFSIRDFVIFHISIHALLAESDVLPHGVQNVLQNISIHALLAESDYVAMVPLKQ